ncbi:MAG: sugar transferase [Bacteroidales bacterium]|nr:sugar transferase [Bacteroidales bacterium]
MYVKYLKRVTDVLFSFFGLLLLLPLLVMLLAILICEYKGSPFFIQVRPGFKEKPIRIIKFKTMNDKKNPEGHLLPNHMRITRTGKLLRELSLDELPQLLNVLLGEMSLVGPRPLLFKYIPLYSEDQRRRHLVRPGITGWAQVNGRNTISWTRKFEYDVWYVDNVSFLLDLKIYWMTALKALKAEGINAGENVTMAPFDGKN